MTIQPKIFSVTAEPYETSAAIYCRKYHSLTFPITDSFWRPEGTATEFKDDYCFRILFWEGPDEYGNIIELEAHQEFYETVRKINARYTFSIEHVPATLLIGKKSGDSLYLKDGTAIQLTTCQNFERLHDQLTKAKAEKDDPLFHPHARLDEISRLLKDGIKPLQSFEAVIFPQCGTPAEYFSKNNEEISNRTSKILWRFEDSQEIEDGYCFKVHFKKPSNIHEDLFENSDFEKILGKIGNFTRWDWIPAKLLIGKKDGDHLTLKDGTVIKLKCGDFRFLEKNLELARVNDRENTVQLNALSDQVKFYYGELTKQVDQEGDVALQDIIAASEPSCLQTFISYTKKIALSIAQFFVRLFTWNWSLKTCLDEASV